MRYWTSDLHFGHANIIRFCNRPYKDVDDMNSKIVKTWNETVGVDDEVWIIGDFAMGQIAETLTYAKLLNGSKTLICGNHDRPWDGHWKKADGNLKKEKWLKKYLDAGFDYVITGYDCRPYGVVYAVLGETDVNHFIPVDVCHFPHSGESDADREDRYSDWRPADHGRWLIHGHVHDAWKVNGRQINVGWDIWGRPIPDSEILNLIEGEN